MWVYVFWYVSSWYCCYSSHTVDTHPLASSALRSQYIFILPLICNFILPLSLILFLYLSGLPFLLQRFLLRSFCTFSPAIQFMHFTDLNFKLTFCAGFISSSNSLFNFVVFVTLLMRYTASFLKEINVSCSFRSEFRIIIFFSLLVIFHSYHLAYFFRLYVCSATSMCSHQRINRLIQSRSIACDFGCLVLFINFFLILFTFNLIFWTKAQCTLHSQRMVSLHENDLNAFLGYSSVGDYTSSCFAFFQFTLSWVGCISPMPFKLVCNFLVDTLKRNSDWRSRVSDYTPFSCQKIAVKARIIYIINTR